MTYNNVISVIFLCAGLWRDGLEFVFSRDTIPSDCLGSQHQLTHTLPCLQMYISWIEPMQGLTVLRGESF